MNALWDFSFKKFFAPRVVGILYALGMVLIGLIALSFIVFGFRGGFLSGLGSLIVTPLFALLQIIALRVLLESLIAVIRVAEASVEIAASAKKTAENTNRIS